MDYTSMDAYKDAVAELSAVSAMWNPFQLIYVQGENGVINQFLGMVHSMQEVGVGILVLMVALRFAKVYLDELHGVPSISGIFGTVLEMVLVTVFLMNYTSFAEIFPNLFHKLTQSILDSYDAGLLDQVISSLKAAGGEKSQEVKWFSLNALSASIPNILSTATAGIALALYFVMSKYQALLYTFWYLVGPILLPFYLFQPFRGVAERWFSSLLSSSFMGVVGALLFILLAKAGWLTKAFASGENTSYVTALVFSILTLLLMVSIPRLSSAIFDGISSSMTEAMATGGMVGGSLTSATVGVAGAAAQTAGASMRGGTTMAAVMRRYGTTKGKGLTGGERILDAIRNKHSFMEEGGAGAKALKTVYDAGSALRDIGRGTLMSQMPSAIKSADKALSEVGRSIEKRKTKSKEEEAVRGKVAASQGEEAAKALSFPSSWRLPRRAGEAFEGAVGRAADGFLRLRKVSDVEGGIRREAEKLVGEDGAKALSIPKNFRLKTRRTGTEEEAMKMAALGLLRKQGAFTPEQKRTLDHESIRGEAIRVLGQKRAENLVIPENWAIIQKNGQSGRAALEGSTRALLQRQGLIDKKDENEIALRYRFSQARKTQAKKRKGEKS